MHLHSAVVVVPLSKGIRIENDRKSGKRRAASFGGHQLRLVLVISRPQSFDYQRETRMLANSTYAPHPRAARTASARHHRSTRACSGQWSSCARAALLAADPQREGCPEPAGDHFRGSEPDRAAARCAECVLREVTGQARHRRFRHDAYVRLFEESTDAAA